MIEHECTDSNSMETDCIGKDILRGAIAMTQPSARREPFVLPLDAGTYWICSCGQSKNAPYCDGSHKGTPFQPTTLELEAPQTVVISDWAKQ